MHDPWTLVGAFPRYRRKPFRARPIVEVWHHDPSDYDSTTCGEGFRRLTHWRHWRLRIVPLRRLVRRVIDRCAHCGGPGTKANPVNISHGHAADLPWWWGRPNVYHRECSQTVERWATQRRDAAERDGYSRGYLDATYDRVRDQTGA